jgi:parvulin-like peptidyl-prolyl cis-trans isomerase-like protein/PPIC-type peptidyl-prolyl cis-trans isomerase-like protein
VFRLFFVTIQPRKAVELSRCYSRRSVILLTTIWLAWPGCGHISSEPTASQSSEDKGDAGIPAFRQDARLTAPISLGVARRYPPGRWRLTSPMRLDTVLLNVSYILIRHVGVTSSQAMFSAGDWTVHYPETRRTSAEALQLIEDLASRIRQGTPFADVARQHSDDPLTRPYGGSLGSQSAGHFIVWPEVLDVIAHTPVGVVSTPIHTEGGFQIFIRHPPPSPIMLSGRRLVIGHSDAPWLQFNARGKAISRTRDEAVAIAASIYEDLVRSPESFELQVRERSEHIDAIRGGDIGEWSSGESSHAWRELLVLRELSVSEISPPVDGAFGIEIIQRTQSRPRSTYAATLLRLPFDPAALASHAFSAQTTLTRAATLSKLLAIHPLAFADYQKEYCCPTVERVVEGRDWAPLERALSGLEPGQVHPTPVQGPASEYWVVRREERVPQIADVSFELPDPVRPDIAWFVGEDGHLAAKAFAAVSKRIQELGLREDQAQIVRQELQTMQRLKQLVPQARLDALDVCAMTIRTAVPKNAYSGFLRMVDEEFERLLLVAH